MDNKQRSNLRSTTNYYVPNYTDQFKSTEEINLNDEKVWNQEESRNQDDVISPLFGIIDWAKQTKTYSEMMHKLSIDETSNQEVYLAFQIFYGEPIEQNLNEN